MATNGDANELDIKVPYHMDSENAKGIEGAEGANGGGAPALQVSGKPVKGAKVQRPPDTTLRLADEYSTDEIIDMEFVDRPLDFLGRSDVTFEGTTTLIAAREKAGKSTLIRHLCHTWVSDGRKVLYLSEEWRRVWHKQLEALGIAKGIGSFQVVEAMGKSPDELLDRARRGPESVIIVDTVTWLMGVSLSQRDEVVNALKPWIGLVKGGKKSLILVAHLTKKGELEGSHVFGAGVDTLIHYTAVEGQTDLRLVQIIGSRMVAETPPIFAVRKSGSTFSVEDAPSELTLTSSQREVLEVLPTEAKNALGWKEVAEKTGFREGKTRKLLRELCDLKLVREVTGNPGGRSNAGLYVAVEEEDEAA